jgi:DnaJ-class molecular chaperone
VIKVTVEDNQNFSRLNDNVVYDLELNLAEAIYGCEKIVDTIDNQKEKLVIMPGIQSQDKITLKNKV